MLYRVLDEVVAAGVSSSGVIVVLDKAEVAPGVSSSGVVSDFRFFRVSFFL